MCGIATISIGRRSRGRISYHRLQDLTTGLMEELQPRGMDASGIAVVNEPGTEESLVFKKALRPSRFVIRPAFKSIVRKIGPHTDFILLHARATTIGDTENNNNNHPIVIPGCLGIHNGTLYNHKKLFNKFQDEFSQTGNVDSEIIFRLFKHYSDKGLAPKQAMQATTQELSGAFTGAVIDWNNQRRMVMFKYDRALSIIRIPYYDIIIAISEPKFYSQVAERIRWKSKSTCEYVYDGTGFMIDLNISHRITDHIIDFEIPVKNNQVNQIRQDWFAHYVH